MKKNTFFIILFVFALFHVHAQFVDDMENYTDGAPISEAHWTDWGCGGGVGCSLMSSSEQARSGFLSGLIPDDTTTDAVLNLGNKIVGTWVLSFWTFIPSNKEAFWIFKGAVPISTSIDVGYVYFNQNNTNPGTGSINDIALGSVSFNFPHDEWFKVEMFVDISMGISHSTWALFINEEVVIPFNTPYTDESGEYPASLGGIEFFSITSENLYYLDDFMYTESWIGDLEFTIDKDFIIYPNPTKNLFFINYPNIQSIQLYNILGKLVIQKQNNFQQIDVSDLTSDVYLVKIETDKGIISKKVVKE